MTRFFKNAVQKEKFNEKDNLFDQDDLTDDNTEQKYIHYQYTADKGQSLLRIDKFLIDKIEEIGRASCRERV